MKRVTGAMIALFLTAGFTCAAGQALAVHLPSPPQVPAPVPAGKLPHLPPGMPPAAAAFAGKGELPYREGEVLVTFRTGGRAEAAKARLSPLAIEVARTQEFASLSRHFGREVALVRGPGKTTSELIALLRVDPEVEAVQPNWIRSIQSVLPDDPRFGELWGLHNAGGTILGLPAVEDADIDAPEAWEVSTGSGAVVASLDTGVDWTHEDLASNMWVNEAEKTGLPGVDDDGNGYVDDVYGWASFSYNLVTEPMDDNGHGTHTAGTMAAARDNATGVAGVAPEARIMALKFLDYSGRGSDADAVACILYAIRMKTDFGVNIVAINASWGGTGGRDGDLLSQVIRMAGEAGIIFVAAAGNSGSDNDRVAGRNYPAGYDLPNIVAVAATGPDDRMPWWSSHGRMSVELAAPGEAVLSTVEGGSDRSIFFDDMESGDGSWLHSGTNDFWAITGEQALSGSHAWSDSPGGNYRPGTQSQLRLDRDLDLSGHQGEDVRLTLNLKMNFSGLIYFAFSRNGGETWYDSYYYIDDAFSPWWQFHQIPIADFFKTASFRFALGYMATGPTTWDGVYVDDVGVGVNAGGNAYNVLSGTSMAAPHVAGTVALLASRFPADDMQTRIRRVLSGVDRLPQLAGRVMTGGRLNAANSLREDLALAPLIREMTPSEGLGVGSQVTLSGAGFGDTPGRVVFSGTPAPTWLRTPRFRVRFALTSQGNYPPMGSGEYGVALDDVSIDAATGDTLFADDMEQGDGNWTHGGRLDTWALSGVESHSPSLAWTSPAIWGWSGLLQSTDSWLALDRDINLTPAGQGELTLSFWARVEGGSFRPEISSDGGTTWRPLKYLENIPGGWQCYRIPIPADGTDAELVSWSEASVTVRVPEGGGRFATLVRPDGLESNTLAGTAWLPEAPPVFPRVYGASAVSKGKIYLTGGVGTDYSPAIDNWPFLGSVAVFDPRRGWSEASPLFPPRAYHASAALGGKIYAVGGWARYPKDGILTDKELDRVEAYDPEEGRWVRRASLPQPVWNGRAAALGGKLYFAGGSFDYGTFDALLAYDPALDSWRAMAPMSQRRAAHGMVSLGGKLYVFGGFRYDFDVQVTYPLGSAERYDPGTDSWSPIASLPAPRYGLSAATDGRLIYLIGGGELWIYDPATDSWRDTLGSSAEPRQSKEESGLAWLPGSGLYHFGGDLYDERVPAVERLPLRRSAALTLLEPNGGEEIPSGSVCTIRWSAPRRARSFNVAYSLDLGRSWKGLARKATGNSLLWNVPVVDRTKGACLVKVTAFDRWGEIIGRVRSLAPFRIVVLEVARPELRIVMVDEGLPDLLVHQQVVVAWRTWPMQREPARVDLLLTVDEGANWREIGSLEGNPGVFAWTAAGIAADSYACRVKVILRDAEGAAMGKDVSPFFTLWRQ